MVLDKLGDSLRSTLKKITGAGVVDEKLVKELAKDIQRALLQADVDVQLVFKLTKRIKERALEGEAPEGISRKEHIVNIVYEEMVKFLGGEAEGIDVDSKKPFKIMLVGLFGAGKCVHPDSDVLLGSGETRKIEDLYEEYESRHVEHELEDGYIIPLSDELEVPSFNPQTMRMENKRVSYLWKLEGKDLYEVELDNGNDFSLKTTPEHPFFVLEEGDRIVKKRADELEEGDYVAVPRAVPSQPEIKDFREGLSELNLDIKVSEEEVSEVKEDIISEFGSLKRAVEELPHNRNYAKFTHTLKKGQVPISLYDIEEDEFMLKEYNAQEWVSFPTRMNADLAEFIGYVIGDGYVSEKGLHISTADEEVIDRVSELSENLFSKKPSLTKDKRSRAKNLRILSTTLSTLFNALLGIPVGRKGRDLEIPPAVQKAPMCMIKKFSRAYFDCESHCAEDSRGITVSSESRTLLKQLNHLLLRLGILSTRSVKEVNGREYYRLSVRAKQAELFSSKIGSVIDRKAEVLEGYERIGLKQGSGKQDMISVSDSLKRLRNSGGYSINQVQEEVSSYGRREKKGLISRSQLRDVVDIYEREKRANVKEFVSNISGGGINASFSDSGMNKGRYNALVGDFKNKGWIEASEEGLVVTESGEMIVEAVQRGVDIDDLFFLKNLAYSDVSWMRVKKSERVENDSDYVYDLTVPGNHSFVADGTIVHNTTTAGKLAKYYQTRGNNVAMVQTDTWRPAAYDQLEQLAEKVGCDFYGLKEAKHPQEVWKKYEDKLQDYDLVIVDTAGRNALNDELIEELNKINSKVKPDENLLVLPADIGQAADEQAVAFSDMVDVNGVVVTKLDGTAKGGGALIACAVTGAPIKFIGVGEKLDEIEEFRPEGFVGRLLGMGDLEALLEKAQVAIDEEKAEDLGKRFLEGEFNLLDLYDQMQAMQKMGSLGKIMEMIPGMSQLEIPEDALEVQEERMDEWRVLMDSMTKRELEDPDVINAERIERISSGAGLEPSSVRSLLKQYRQAKKMAKMMKGGSEKDLQKLMDKMQGRGGGNLPF